MCIRDRHLGAADQVARVWVNGQDACVHTGGYLPFAADITDSVSYTHLLICMTAAAPPALIIVATSL